MPWIGISRGGGWGVVVILSTSNTLNCFMRKNLNWENSGYDSVSGMCVTLLPPYLTELFAFLFQLPEDFEIMFDDTVGELVVGGIYLRLFIQQPAWVSA